MRKSSGMATPRVDGSSLARFHRDGSAHDDGIRLLDYAESPRRGDWSLRSALVRYAQPQPARASAVLELVRRTDGALKPHARLLDRTTTPTDPEIGPERFAGPAGFEPSAAARVDARSADLARLAVRAPDDLDRVLDEYERIEPLDPDERAAIPLLAVAVELDALGDALADWADDRQGPRPDATVEAVARLAFERLAALGVAREQRPPRRS